MKKINRSLEPAIKARLDLMIDEDLKKWAVEYARRQDVTVTWLVTEHFRSLKAREETPDVDQV